MLSNLKLSAIKDKLTYLKTYLKNEGKYLDPQGMKVLNKQLSIVKAQLNEAYNRRVVGYTADGLQAYLAPSVIDGADVELLYIESLPTGYDVEIVKGESVKLQIEGDWSETVEFYQ